MKANRGIFSSTLVFPGAAAALLAACATAPPPTELVNARVALERARTGVAARYAPADVYDARRALERAEAAYLDDGDDPRTRDLAYVAQRRADLAQARGELLAARHGERESRLQIDAIEDRQRREAQSMVQAERTARVQTQQALTEERGARVEAERRAAQALESLRQLASLRQENDRTILSLSGEVLFATGEATLLPIAQQRLSSVAESLIEVGFERITVEGHTDSRGAFARNEELSLRRAQAVAAFLVSRGLPHDRVQAMGLGESRPVASNATPEGRANNRRVEIVVHPVGGAR